jgi:hypothetical protein
MKRKLAFTLLEAMIAISLMLIAAGAIGWKMEGMIARKRFQSDVEKFQSRLLVCHRLALNTQADWRGNLVRDGEKWIFTVHCIENPKLFPLPPLSLRDLSLFLEGEKREEVSFDFTATGEVFPKGRMKLSGSKGLAVEWLLPELFSLEEGDRKGPAHPDDLNLRQQFPL